MMHPFVPLALLLCWLTVRVLSPGTQAPPHWSSLPLVPALNGMFSSQPVSSGILGDTVTSLSLPLIRHVLLGGREELREGVGVALGTLSSMCKAHVALDEVIDFDNH